MTTRQGQGLGVLVVLAGGLITLGLAPLAMPDSYSWVKYGTSESGAQGIEGAWVARTGFLLFGLGVIWTAELRHRDWGPAGTFFHGVFGVSMVAVAAFSTRPWDSSAPYVATEDLLHSVFATAMGFGFIVGVVAVMMTRRYRSVYDAIPDLAALAITISIPLFMSSDIWGILQRMMFVTAGAWYGREVLRTKRGNEARPDSPG